MVDSLKPKIVSCTCVARLLEVGGPPWNLWGGSLRRTGRQALPPRELRALSTLVTAAPQTRKGIPGYSVLWGTWLSR